MDVVVQPSVPWMSLNDQIKDSGLFFPVDPGPSVSGSNWGCRSGSGVAQTGIPRFANIRDRPGSAAWLARVAGNSIANITIAQKLNLNSGTNAVRYGTMKEWVINLTVVLADGTVIKTRKRPR